MSQYARYIVIKGEIIWNSSCMRSRKRRPGHVPDGTDSGDKPCSARWTHSKTTSRKLGETGSSGKRSGPVARDSLHSSDILKAAFLQ
jgi:hypothetical protein